MRQDYYKKEKNALREMAFTVKSYSSFRFAQGVGRHAVVDANVLLCKILDCEAHFNFVRDSVLFDDVLGAASRGKRNIKCAFQ